MRRRKEVVMRKCGRDEQDHPVYAYRLTIAARFLAQSIILFPCSLLLLSFGFVAYVALRNYISGAVDWRGAATIIGMLGVGLFMARHYLAELPMSFKVYDVEGRLKVIRGKDQFYVTEVLDDYAVRARTKFNKQFIAGLTCYCLKIKTNKGVRILSFLSAVEKTKFKSILVKYNGAVSSESREPRDLNAQSSFRP